ncbi:MAG: hypothetical protein IPI90_14320 [Saprospiraceae bacterium]|nr:hypothetical protein [Candidatus Vicinibacter affinis]
MTRQSTGQAFGGDASSLPKLGGWCSTISSVLSSVKSRRKDGCLSVDPEGGVALLHEQLASVPYDDGDEFKGHKVVR